MKTFLVITKIKTEENSDQKNPSRTKIDEKGRKYNYVNIYLETWKFIIETNSKDNIYTYFKNTKHRLVNVQEVESFSNSNSKSKKDDNDKKKNIQKDGSSFTLGELFKDQLAGFGEKNEQPYLNEKNKKQLKKKFLKEEKRIYS